MGGRRLAEQYQEALAEFLRAVAPGGAAAVTSGPEEPSRQPPAADGKPVDELVRAAAVGADLVRRPRGHCFGSWAKPSRAASMWSAPVGARIPVAEEPHQRMVPEGPLPNRGCLLPLGVRDNQHTVQVHEHLPDGLRRILNSQRLYMFAYLSAGLPQCGQRGLPAAASLSISRDTVGSEATGPNADGSARSMPTSATTAGRCGGPRNASRSAAPPPPAGQAAIGS